MGKINVQIVIPKSKHKCKRIVYVVGRIKPNRFLGINSVFLWISSDFQMHLFLRSRRDAKLEAKQFIHWVPIVTMPIMLHIAACIHNYNYTRIRSNATVFSNLQMKAVLRGSRTSVGHIETLIVSGVKLPSRHWPALTVITQKSYNPQKNVIDIVCRRKDKLSNAQLNLTMYDMFTRDCNPFIW